MYAIVSYDDTCETDFVPMKWLTDEYSTSGVEVLIENRIQAKFYWPPWRNMSSVTNARRRCVDPETEWPTYAARILATADNETDARFKTREAELTSNVEAECDNKRRTKRPHRYEDELSDEDRSGDNNDNRERERKQQKTKKSKVLLSSKAHRSQAAQTLQKSRDNSVVLSKRDKPLPPTSTDRLCMMMHESSPGGNVIDTNTTLLEEHAVTRDEQLSATAPPANGSMEDYGIMPVEGQSGTPCTSGGFDDAGTDSPGNREDRSLSVQAGISGSTGNSLAGFACRQESVSDTWPRGMTDRGDTGCIASTPVTGKSGARTGTDLNTKLLLRILTSLEDAKQTLKDHSVILHSLLRRGSGGVFTGDEVPDGLNFPLESPEDIDNAEEKLSDAATRAALINLLCDNGGDGLTNFVKRNMKYLIAPDLARIFNLTGQRGKRAFQGLRLNQIMFAAAKQNPSTKECTKKAIEEQLQTWFANARDRGAGGRKLN